MSSPEISIPVEHVSDTAFLVALYRAYESEREDSNFKDPFARKLASPKAEYLAKVLPENEVGPWMLAVRTRLIDDHILRLVSQGVDTVINLAAGLDTRPYRLDLSSSLRWIEADFPEITRYKTERLADEKPRCRLERVVIDLSDDGARRKFLTSVLASSKKALVITEGLLPYLTESAVNALATDLQNQPAVRYWLMDITGTRFIHWFRNEWPAVEPGQNTPSVKMQFSPEDGVKYFERFGWRADSYESFVDGSERIRRKLPVKMITDEKAMVFADDAGIALFTRV